MVDTPFGVAALLYDPEPFVIREVLLPRISPEDQPERAMALPEDADPPAGAAETARALRRYFDGLPVPVPDCLDLGGLSELQTRVLEAVVAIPYGQTRSYGEIAAAAGRPGAARFVGACMARNRFPVFVPCHRVVRADGGLGGFGGGLDLKRRMLDLEAGAAG